MLLFIIIKMKTSNINEILKSFVMLNKDLNSWTTFIWNDLIEWDMNILKMIIFWFYIIISYWIWCHLFINKESNSSSFNDYNENHEDEC
jgi:hypothetical protein